MILNYQLIPHALSVSHKKVAFYLLDKFNQPPDINITRLSKNTFNVDKCHSPQKRPCPSVSSYFAKKLINEEKL